MRRLSVRARLDALVWRLHCEVLYRLAQLWRRVVCKTEFIAVTGSRGKTTCKNLIASILAAEGETVATIGNDNGLLGVPRTVLAVRPRHRFAVVEAGTDAPGIMERWSRLLRPRVAVLLAVAPAHRKRFKTLGATAAEKARIFDRLEDGGSAVLNADDEHVARIRPPAGASIVGVGTGGGCEVRILETTSRWPERLRVTLKIDGRNIEVRTSLVGTHWATSVAAAVAVARVLGVTPEAAARGIATVLPGEARMEPVVLPNGVVVIRDEYQGGEDTYPSAFDVIAQARTAGRRILVIGDPTDSRHDTSTRIRRVARAGAQACDLLVFFGAHSRHAVAAIIAAGLPRDRIRVCATIEEAADFLRRETVQGDLIVFKGRTADHATRALFAAWGTIRCTLLTCRKMFLCEHCSELGYSPSRGLTPSDSSGSLAWKPLVPESHGGRQDKR